MSHIKKTIYEYLFLFLRKIRPKSVVRQFLHVPYLLKNAKNQRRIIRFALAFNQLIKSNFYKDIFKKNELKLEIITISKEKVHAELKLMNSSIIKAYQRIEINELDADVKKIYVSPSRKLCSLCLGAFQSFNIFEKNLNIKFIYPFSEKIQNINYFKFPNFKLYEGFDDSFYKDIEKNLQNLSYNADLIREKEKNNINFVPNTYSHKYNHDKNKSKSSEKDKNSLSSNTDKVEESFIQGSQFTFDSILKSEDFDNIEVVETIDNHLFNSVKNFFEQNNDDNNIENKIIIAKNFSNFFNEYLKK